MDEWMDESVKIVIKTVDAMIFVHRVIRVL